MTTLQSSFYAVAIISCLLCAFVVGSERAPKRFVFLIAYLVLESLRYLFQWLMVQPAAPAKAVWLGLLMASSFLVAPALWMFAREIAEEHRPSLRSLRGPHLIAIVTGMLLTVPLFLTAHPGTGYTDPDNIASPLHSLFIHTTMLMAVVLFLFQVPYYLAGSMRLFARHVDISKAMFSDVEPDAIGTLRLMVFIVCMNWLVGLLRALHCLTLGPDTGFGIVFCLLEVGVTAFVVFALMRRTTVFSLEDRALARELFVADAAASEACATRDKPELSVADAAANEESTIKYARSALDAPARTRIRRKLAEAMTTGRLHRDSGVNLRGLCESLNENPHYVSQVINQDLSTNFYDLIKKHRVDDAMTALIAAPEKTVLEIALAVGFNSKSTFNAAFRQYVGMTPREYRNARSNAQGLAQRP